MMMLWTMYVKSIFLKRVVLSQKLTARSERPTSTTGCNPPNSVHEDRTASKKRKAPSRDVPSSGPSSISSIPARHWWSRASILAEAACAVTAQSDVEGWSHDAVRVGDGAFGGLAELEVIPAVSPLIVPSRQALPHAVAILVVDQNVMALPIFIGVASCLACLGTVCFHASACAGGRRNGAPDDAPAAPGGPMPLLGSRPVGGEILTNLYQAGRIIERLRPAWSFAANVSTSR